MSLSCLKPPGASHSPRTKPKPRAWDPGPSAHSPALSQTTLPKPATQPRGFPAGASPPKSFASQGFCKCRSLCLESFPLDFHLPYSSLSPRLTLNVLPSPKNIHKVSPLAATEPGQGADANYSASSSASEPWPSSCPGATGTGLRQQFPGLGG